MASSPSFSTTTTSEERRYDVFLSFRGEDTRKGFTSHLCEALRKNQIFTFIDNNLERGDDISPSLLTAIEESLISVIIFSEDYANSRWCLKELIKIFQCKERNGQIVIPVFYGVDPSHVRKQIGKFGVAFDKLKKRLREGEMDLNEVRSHLEEAANISGWNSHDISPESELIKSIVGDILKKLNQMTFKLPSNLVGIGSHIERVEALLCLESPQFRKVGLWGMGGIGKTTVATIVYHRICSTFDGFYFVEKVSQKLKNQSMDDLREEIMLKLFEEESLNMGSRTFHHDFIMKQLQRKKVLIVLDDVDDAIEAQKLLAGENDHLFSGGSRILVTSRDKQVLKNIVGDQNLIYEVEGLNREDGLQLFSLRAFKQNHPTSDRLELSERVFNYSRGNPLALVVLGHALFDKSKEEWVSALDGLGEESFPEIQKVLRISYDALCDEEKSIFLDIASIFVEKKWDFVVAYYKGSVRKIEYKINKLVDKSLMTISENKHLEMHDLLKEMGRSIESARGLEKCIRIWDLKDLIRVSKKMKGSSMIEAISVNLCQGERISEFDCSVLARLDRLKFLEFKIFGESKVRFCWERFRGFRKGLRYLRWDAYPCKSLSSKFCAENLVELHMPGSAISKLWTDKQNIVNLQVINFEGANKLVEFPDVSEGRNIERINLGWCHSLVKFPPSIQHLPKLKILELVFCSSVESVPTTFDSKVLGVIDLSYCGGVKMFPRLASANIITELNLSGTDIREVPSSVELLKGLQSLSMSGCKKLSIISINICKLKSLSQLELWCCINLESFPEIMEPMESLTCLNLGGCTILERLPNDHSFHNLKSLEELYLNDTAITELPSSIQHLICLQKLRISGCQNLTSLPSFIHNQRMLELDLKGCSNLCSLPELPSSLETLEANGCVSLKTISSACLASESKTRILKFENCFNLDEVERRRVLDIAFSNILNKLARQEIPEEHRVLLDNALSILFEGFLEGFLEERRKVLDLISNFDLLSSQGFLEEVLEGVPEEHRTLLDNSSSPGFQKVCTMCSLQGFQKGFLESNQEVFREEFLKNYQKGFLKGFLKTYQKEGAYGRYLKRILEEQRVLDLDRPRILEEHRILLDYLSSPGYLEKFLKRILKEQKVLNLDQLEILNYHNFEIILPWSEIPQWFCGSQSVGSSLTLKLPMVDRYYKFAFCVVIKPNYGNSVGCNHMYCHVDDNDAWVTSCEFNLEPGDTEHLLLWYHRDIALWKYFGREVSFQFRDEKGDVEVTKCGVLILPVEDTRNAESYS